MTINKIYMSRIIERLKGNFNGREWESHFRYSSARALDASPRLPTRVVAVLTPSSQLRRRIHATVHAL